MRVVVVAASARFGQRLQRDLAAGGHAVTVVPDEGTALAAVADGQADVLVVAVPPAAGRALCRSALQQGVATPLLLMTGNSAAGVAGLQAGADAYLVTPVAPIELQARLGVWERRLGARSSPILTAGPLRLDPVAHRVWRDGTERQLPPKLFRVLDYLMRHPGQTLTPAMITAAVWEDATPPRDGVIAVSIHHLRRALDDPAPGRLIQTVRGVGYRLVPDR